MSENKISADYGSRDVTDVEPKKKPAFQPAPVLAINADPYANAVDTIRRMRGYSKCFTNSFERGQAVFVLSEQDDTAYMAVAQWIKCNIERLGANHPKIINAKYTLARFMKAREQGRTKLPD
jgi:hypothetical protein